MSPQHWAQHLRSKPNQEGVTTTYKDKVVVTWQGCTKTVQLNDKTNVASFNSSPGYTKFQAFCAECGEEVEDNPVTFPTMVSDDEESVHSDQEEREDPRASKCTNSMSSESSESPRHVDFNLESPADRDTPTVIKDEEERQKDNVAAELLKIYQRIGHISPRRIQQMTKVGTLQRKLATCDIPVCTSCMYGKATKSPWRSKNSKNQVEANKPSRPGECISVDQLISQSPGLISQMRGRPTHQRYTCASVYVDQFTDYTFTFLQKTTTAEETIEEKRLFERRTGRMGHKITHYHADNGGFASHAWRDHCADNQQQLTFVAVGAHHMNGVAEAKIKQLQSLATTMMIHANQRSPTAINANLWPYTVRMATNVMNSTSSTKLWDIQTPRQAVERTNVATNVKHWHPFGCPVYALQRSLQSGNIFDKWKSQARVGIYLGRSPQHARSVALVLCPITGLVSPQFHAKMDRSFQTVMKAYGEEPPPMQWTDACGFNQEQGKESGKDKTKGPSHPLHTSDGISITSPSEPSSPDPEELPSAEGVDMAATNKDQELPPLRRSTRDKKPPEWFVAHEALMEIEDTEDLIMDAHVRDPDTMYYHEAMREPDRDKFLQAMDKEVHNQIDADIIHLVEKKQVPLRT